jgi:hypothetical protein
VDDGTLGPFCSFAPSAYEPPVCAARTGRTFSGRYWVGWADIHAKNSSDINDLAGPFQSRVRSFIAALQAGGASVRVSTTRRDAKRAYLFHWSWLIGLGKANPWDAPPRPGVDIEWNHGELHKSQAAAREMIKGFGLAVPPKSKLAPALASNHIAGNAIDMDILWKGDLPVKDKNGGLVTLAFNENANANLDLHKVGASFGVIKNPQDAPHWSINGR